MEIGSIFLLLMVVAGVVLFVARPFVENQRTGRQSPAGISALLAERERITSVLQELDFDHLLGKVDCDEYSSQRARLVQKGAGVLRSLDAFRANEIQSDETPNALTSLSQLEKAASDEELENLIAKRRAGRAKKMSGFCPKCGRPVLESDRFCSSCGQAVSQSQPGK